LPFEQTWPAAHCTPHMPQFLLSVSVLVQVPLQSFVGAGQEHMPAAHALPPVQTVPHMPQFVGSVERFVHTPLQSA
jgi:hypothetical protein